MTNINNIIELAKISHEAESYQDSYKYCSIILENDINNSMAWVNKGIAAAFLTDSSGSKIFEAITLVKKGIELDKKQSIDRDELAIRLKKSYNKYVNYLNDIILGKIQDFAKISKPEGGSALIHRLGQAMNQLKVAQSQASARLLGLELIYLMCYVNPKESTYKEANIAFTNAKNHSKENGNYFEKDEELNAKFQKMLDRINEEAINRFPGVDLIIDKKDKFNKRIEKNSSNSVDGERELKLPLAVGIFFMPYLFSWFTLRKGYSNRTRIFSFLWLIAIVVSTSPSLKLLFQTSN